MGQVAPLAAVLAAAVGLVFGEHHQSFGAPSSRRRPDKVIGGGGVVQAYQFASNHLCGQTRLELRKFEVRREDYHWG